MAQRKAKRPPLRYSWAHYFSRHSPEYDQLSAEGKLGLRYAQSLAWNASERSALALTDRYGIPEKLTVAELADQDGQSPVAIHRLIRTARIELFGKDLSPSAISYRLSQLEARRGRTCAQPRCKKPITPQQPLNRLYCDQHAQPLHRISRHRKNAQARECDVTA
jgi:hypothetical protein